MSERLRHARRLGLLAVVLVALVSAAGYLQDLARPPVPGMPWGVTITPEGGFFLKDFVVHHGVAQAAWAGEIERPYRFEAQAEFWRTHWPAMPLSKPAGYTPLWYLVGAPATALPLSAGFGAWMTVCLLALGALWWWVLAPAVTSRPQLWLLLGVTLSLDVFLGLREGQPSLVTAAALGALWWWSREGEPRTWSRDLALGLLVLAAGIKPGPVLIALGLLIGQQRWRALAMGLAAMGAWCLAITPWLGGAAWPTDYAAMLRGYRWDAVPETLAQAMTPLSGTNLTVPLYTWLGVPVATLLPVFSLLTLLTWIGLVFARLKGWASPAFFVQGLVFNYLLFAPQLTCTEDVLLLLAIAAGGA
ncbi:MAG: glycosyltransferase family 87 protein, partial [Verrucomicrobiota bacterium]